MAKKKTAKKASSKASRDKFYKIVIVGDDGNSYALEKSDWMVQEKKVTDAATQSAVEVLDGVGSYLSFVSPKRSVGAGMACVVVNMAAILKNNLPSKK